MKDKSYAEDLIIRAYGRKEDDIIGQAWVEIGWIKEPVTAYGIRKAKGHIGQEIYGIYLAGRIHKIAKKSGNSYWSIEIITEKNKLFWGEEGLNLLRKYILYLKS